MTTPRRRPSAQHQLVVDSTEWLGPHLVRMTASGESLAQFTDTGCTDTYVKLLFVDPALGLEPPYDLAELRQSLPPDQRPVTRTYTIRSIDRTARQLAIDFVVHGDEGIAAPWAAHAIPGDRLVLSGPGSGYAPDPATTWHVFAGDLSALPAIAAALETLPATANGIAHLEVGNTDDITELTNRSRVAVSWLVNPDPADTDFLARAVDGADWPTGADAAGVQVFAHGERESIKAIRAVLRSRDIPKDAISISGYWARGRTEDIFQAEKAQPVGRID